MNSSLTSALQYCSTHPELCLTREFQPGDLISLAGEDDGSFLLIRTGSIRFVDSSRSFSSLTLSIVDAPYLLESSIFSGCLLTQPVRAATCVSAYQVCISRLPTEVYTSLFHFWKSCLDPREWILIHECLRSTQDQSSLTSPLLDLSPSSWPCLSDALGHGSFRTVIYLDAPRFGFNYGHIYPFQFLESEYPEAGLPRCYPIFDSLDGHKSVEETPQLFASPSIDESLDPVARDFSEPVANHETAVDSSPRNDFLPSEYGFDLIHSTDLQSSLVACLSMLCRYLKLPTRRDVLQKFVDRLPLDHLSADQLRNQLLSFLDGQGLSVSLLRAPEALPIRIPTPCLVLSDDLSPALIVGSSYRAIQVLDPLDGALSFQGSQVFDYLQERSSLLSIGVGIHTPQQRFSYGWFLPYLSQYRLQLLEVVSASFLTQLFALATPLLFQQLIDRVVSKGAADSLGPLIFLMLIFLILEISFSTLRTFQFVGISNRIDIGIGSSIISRLLRIHGRFFDRRPVGELAGRLQEIDSIRRFLTGTALTAVLDAFFASLYFVVMFVYSPVLSLIVACSVPLLLLATIGMAPVTQRLIRKRAEASSRTQSFLVEVITGIQTIKLQNSELLAKRQWEQRHLRTIDVGYKAVMANTASSSFLQFINKLTNIFVIGFGSWQVLQNQMTIGELIAFRIISGYVTQPLLRLASIWQNFQELSLSFERVSDVVNQPLENGDPGDSLMSMPRLIGSLRFEDVSYRYSSSMPNTLSGFGLTIEAGSFVGLVGQSGCGKSTLLKLVPRFYVPDSGRVLVDDIDISKVDIYSLRSQVGYVPQDCMLFEGSIFSNIVMGNPDASSEDVIQVAKLACAHDFIMGLKQGYNTRIGERGSGVSGGQRQRIALARMFLSSPRLIILDEATSALDADTERQVVANIRRHFVDETVLMITHRLSSLQAADRIVVMHAGTLDSMGTHLELMEMKGRYFALYQSQFAG